MNKCKNPLLKIVATIVATHCFLTLHIQAQSVWGQTAASTYTWNTAGNWASGGVPNGVDAIADFSQVAMSGSEIVTVSADTVGTLILGNNGGASGASWTLTSSTLTLAASSGTPNITANVMAGGGTNLISTTLYGTQGFNLTGGGILLLNDNLANLSGNVTIKQGTLCLNASDATGDNSVNEFIVGDPLGGNATLMLGPSAHFVLSTPVLVPANAAGTVTIGQEGASHSTFAGPITLNGPTLTVENLTTASSAVLDVSGGITGTGNVILTNNGGSGASITVETAAINNSGTLTLAGPATGSGKITISGGIGPNVTAIDFDSTLAEAPTVDDITNGGNLVLANNSTLTPTTTTWAGSGTLTLDCNSSGNFSLGSIGAFTGAIVNSGTGTGETSVGTIINSSESITQNSAASSTFLSGSNLYAGSTIINAGTLLLTNNGSILYSTNISITAGATFDISGATNAFTLGNPTTLTASGTGITAGTSAAINAQSGETISLSANPIVLNFDGSDPALYIPQGILSLNGNPFTINGTVLANGTYTLVEQASGSIASAGTYPPVTGTAIGSGQSGVISVSGGAVSLIVSTGVAPSISSLVPDTGRTNGGTAVTINGANFQSGATVQFGSTTPIAATFVSSTQLSVTTPAQPPGPVMVTVANPTAQTAASSFTYVLPPAPATISSMAYNVGTLTLTWSGGANESCELLSSTNLTLPIFQWTPITTNAVGADGLSTNSIVTDPATPQQFYLLAIPYN